MKVPRCWCGGKRRVDLNDGPGNAIVRCKKCGEMKVYHENKTEHKAKGPGNALRARRPKKK